MNSSLLGAQSGSQLGSQLPGAEPHPSDVEEALARALESMGPSYVARTRHKHADGRPRYVNRLLLESSPYLLQHAHNPVNWYPWGEEAFRVARETNRPVLLSVGYSTCHWCHVMEEESFEDSEIAAFINQHYVAIKVDREERPDVDSVYMTAVQLMNQGAGGWPMTVVMTPDRRPFFGGTYFPPRDGSRGSRVGFLTVLSRLLEAYRRDPAMVENSANQLVEAMTQHARPEPPQGVPGPAALFTAARLLVGRFDPQFGGFGAAPKFPRPTTYELLLRYHRRTRDEAALEVVTRSLGGMIAGGIHDHVGGGFHRYSTDAQWLVPHFEKMLYDNAQLVTLLVEAHQVTGDALYAETAVETLEYVLREMTSPEGAFYSATDADSEGEEGTFFVWKPAELVAVLGPEKARIARAGFGVTEGGNFEGKNILHRMRPAAEVAEELGISEATLEEELAAAARALYDARAKRPQPLRDDKILTEWNAQMISAFSRAGLALGAPRFIESAVRAGEFILSSLRDARGRLLRAHRGGVARHSGVLEDYAFTTAAWIDLFEATGDPKWLDEALALQALTERHFLDPSSGAFFGTADDAEALLMREKPTYDGAQPSGNSVAVLNLLRLGTLTDDPRLRSEAERALRALGASLERGAVECPKLAQALDYFLDEPKEIVIVTTASDDGEALLRAVGGTFVPNRVLVRVREGAPLEALGAKVPLVRQKRAIGGAATAYVCRKQTCEAPTSKPEVLEAELEKVEPFPLMRKLTLPR